MLPAKSRLAAMVEELAKRGGSDLHLAVNQPPLGRIEGDLVALQGAPIAGRELEDMLLELASPGQRSRLASDLDVEFSFELEDIARVRASYFVKHSGIAATFRLIATRPPTLAELSAPDVLWRLSHLPSGLVVLAGPAGSGKTATAAALVDQINRTRGCHIVTIERPIEFVYEPERAQITQREVGTHVASHAAALASVPRASADVVFVSDPLEPTDFEQALALACDGRLVIMTMTGSSVTALLGALLESFPSSARSRLLARLAEALAAVVVQHRLPAEGGVRIAVHEILLAHARTAALLREGKLDELASVMASGAEGMETLDAGLERLLSVGKITPALALATAVDKDSFVKVVAKLRPET